MAQTKKATAKKAPAKKKTAAKKNTKLAEMKQKRVTVESEALIGTPEDTPQNIEDRHMDAVAGVEGKVMKGLLDPTDFDLRDIETLRPFAAETERISKIVTELLDKHFSRGGKYKWEVGFFLPGDPACNGVGGWKVLSPASLGPYWTNEFRATAGLHDWEGAVCWAGRGRMDRHVLCVMTTKLRQDLRTLHDKRTMDQFKELNAPEGSEGVETTEEQIKVPLHYDRGQPAPDAGTDPTEEAESLEL